GHDDVERRWRGEVPDAVEHGEVAADGRALEGVDDDDGGPGPVDAGIQQRLDAIGGADLVGLVAEGKREGRVAAADLAAEPDPGAGLAGATADTEPGTGAQR